MRGSYTVAIAGNIGAGKSTLATLLAENLGWVAVLEPADANPYLADFYTDMRRWSFHSQVFFLSRRFIQYRLLRSDAGSVIYDRTIYEDAEVFARHLYELGHMPERDWRTYRELYETLRSALKPPDLVIYLRASVQTILGRVQARGYEYERGIEASYLTSLDELYDRWASGFTLAPLVRIDTDQVDFVNSAHGLETVRTIIVSRLRGNETKTA